MATLAQIMDAIAAQLTAASVAPRVTAYPPGEVNPPEAVVAYPTVDFDATFGRGADTWIFPIYLVAGTPHLPATKAALSAIVDGANGVKAALDGTLGGVVDTTRVQRMEIVTINLGGIDYMAARFEAEVIV